MPSSTPSRPRHWRAWITGRLLVLPVAVAPPLLAGAPAAPASAHTTGWRITDLGVLPGGVASTATAVNDRDDVAGYSDTGPAISPTHAVLWHAGRELDLGTLGGTGSTAAGLNDAQDVVGTSQTSSGSYHAFRWRQGRMIDLGTLGGASSGATAVNNRGEVVGYSETETGSVHAFLWRPGRMIDLGTLNGGFSRAYAVNDRGQAVGDSSVDGMNSVPVMFSGGTVIPLNHLFGQGSAISNAGRVAGYRFGGGGSFSWYRGHTVVLPLPEGAGFAQAQGINERGQIVGSGDSGALLWEQGHVTTLPPLPGGSTAGAMALNERGVVVGYASRDRTGGNAHAVMWRSH
jgi:probable HAF family extracellular repeat protein